jgi:hypothetical protein
LPPQNPADFDSQHENIRASIGAKGADVGEMGLLFTEEESKVEEHRARGPLKDIRTHAPTKEF